MSESEVKTTAQSEGSPSSHKRDNSFEEKVGMARKFDKEMKDYAKATVKEFLGIYGYEEDVDINMDDSGEASRVTETANTDAVEPATASPDVSQLSSQSSKKPVSSTDCSSNVPKSQASEDDGGPTEGIIRESSGLNYTVVSTSLNCTSLREGLGCSDSTSQGVSSTFEPQSSRAIVTVSEPGGLASVDLSQPLSPSAGTGAVVPGSVRTTSPQTGVTSELFVQNSQTLLFKSGAAGPTMAIFGPTSVTINPISTTSVRTSTEMGPTVQIMSSAKSVGQSVCIISGPVSTTLSTIGAASGAIVTTSGAIGTTSGPIGAMSGVTVTVSESTVQGGSGTEFQSPICMEGNRDLFGYSNLAGISSEFCEDDSGLSRKEKNRLHMRDKRLAETVEAREIRLKHQRERARLRRSNETEGEREFRLVKDRVRQRLKRTQESMEAREQRLTKQRLAARERRANESPEDKQTRMVKDRERTRRNREAKRAGVVPVVKMW